MIYDNETYMSKAASKTAVVESLPSVDHKAADRQEKQEEQERKRHTKTQDTKTKKKRLFQYIHDLYDAIIKPGHV
jgi:hypothetical protein